MHNIETSGTPEVEPEELPVSYSMLKLPVHKKNHKKVRIRHTEWN